MFSRVRFRYSPVGLAIGAIMVAAIVVSALSYRAVVSGFALHDAMIETLKTSYKIELDFASESLYSNPLASTDADIDTLNAQTAAMGIAEVDSAVQRLRDLQREWATATLARAKNKTSPREDRRLGEYAKEVMDDMHYRIRLNTDDMQLRASRVVGDAKRTMVVGALGLLASIALLGVLGMLVERSRRYQQQLAAVARERELARVSELAFHDQLTGLQNRASFMLSFEQVLDRAQRSAQGVACLFVDLDGFKAVNDTLGHQAGDQVLQSVAKLLRASVRKSDIVGRLGGDEFVLVLPAIAGPNDVAIVADKVLRAVAEPIDVGGAAAHVSASVGISFSPEDGTDAEHLLQLADGAMYVAKNGGKNRFAFYEPAPATDEPTITGLGSVATST